MAAERELRPLPKTPVFVEEDHHHHRGEEWSDGGVEDVAGVTGQDALGPTFLLQHPAAVRFYVRFRLRHVDSDRGEGGGGAEVLRRTC